MEYEGESYAKPFRPIVLYLHVCATPMCSIIDYGPLLTGVSSLIFVLTVKTVEKLTKTIVISSVTWLHLV